jgi:hypothetical protein
VFGWMNETFSEWLTWFWKFGSNIKQIQIFFHSINTLIIFVVCQFNSWRWLIDWFQETIDLYLEFETNLFAISFILFSFSNTCNELTHIDCSNVDIYSLPSNLFILIRFRLLVEQKLHLKRFQQLQYFCLCSFSDIHFLIQKWILWTDPTVLDKMT